MDSPQLQPQCRLLFQQVSLPIHPPHPNENSIKRRLSSDTRPVRKLQLFDAVTFCPCAPHRAAAATSLECDVIFCQNRDEQKRIRARPMSNDKRHQVALGSIIRSKHIKVFSICVHPLMVPTSDAHSMRWQHLERKTE
jgi:hypothetical protein